MEDRDTYAHQLLEDATQHYREELSSRKLRGEAINQEDIHSRHSSLLKEGIDFAVLEYSKQNRFQNNIFSRAASIGYYWAGGYSRAREETPTNDVFGHTALAVTILQFLRTEGAELLSNTHQFLEAVKTTTTGLRPLQVFMKLQEVIAHHWVCANGNDCEGVPVKLCHCTPVIRKQNILEIRGPRKGVAGQLKEAEGDKTKLS
jgi:hypothetical protein